MRPGFTPGGNYTCTSSSTTGACGVWNVYMRSSADGATFDHPYGDYTETCLEFA